MRNLETNELEQVYGGTFFSLSKKFGDGSGGKGGGRGCGSRGNGGGKGGYS